MLRWLALITLICFAFPAIAEQGQHVRLQLKWAHQFQFAGYYAAVEHGYFAEEGLSVELLPASPGVDPVAHVLSGGAEYGVGTSDLIMLHHQGQPVVVLAVIFQHSPLALLSQRADDLESIHDLVGRRVAIEPGSAELLAYLKREGMDIDSLDLVRHEMELGPLLRGEIYAQSIYVTTEPFTLDELGFPYQIYSPRSVGIDFYGDNLFTTRAELKVNPDRTAAFLRASLRGWYYAMNNVDEIIDLILEKYPTNLSRAALQFEAEQMQRLMRTDLIEPGHMIPGRWRHMAEIYAEIGMLPEYISLDGLLYDPEGQAIDLKRYYLAMLVLAVLAVLFAIATWSSKRVNQIIRGSEQRFRALFDHAPLAFIVSDGRGRITGWNGAATRIFGWQPDEALGQDLKTLLVAPSDRDPVAHVVNTTFAGESTGLVNKNITRDGREIQCEWANAPFIDSSQGRTEAIISIGADITRRIELEASLRAARNTAQEALEDSYHLISMLSHELRSPMSAIAYSIEVIDDACSHGKPEMIPDMTKRIRQSLKRLRNFVDGLTAEDRLAGHDRVRPHIIHMQELLDKLVTNLQYAHPERVVETQLTGHDKVVVADAVMFEILIANLLDNAAKYSPKDTPITLTITVDDVGSIKTEVADRGPGIEPELHSRLFRKYVRGKQENMANGLGLGLFYVHRIVEQCGGTIKVQEREGGGACFLVELPPVGIDQAEV